LGNDFALEFLEFLHFVLGLDGFALFAVEGGETEVGLSGQGALVFDFEEFRPGLFCCGRVAVQGGSFAKRIEGFRHS